MPLTDINIRPGIYTETSDVEAGFLGRYVDGNRVRASIAINLRLLADGVLSQPPPPFKV